MTKSYYTVERSCIAQIVRMKFCCTYMKSTENSNSGRTRILKTRTTNKHFVSFGLAQYRPWLKDSVCECVTTHVQCFVVGGVTPDLRH